MWKYHGPEVTSDLIQYANNCPTWFEKGLKSSGVNQTLHKILSDSQLHAKEANKSNDANNLRGCVSASRHRGEESSGEDEGLGYLCLLTL